MTGPSRPHPEANRLASEGVETETRLSATGRVEAFSDGVMAIAITLLVLDLKVPEGIEPGGLAGRNMAS